MPRAGSQASPTLRGEQVSVMLSMHAYFLLSVIVLRETIPLFINLVKVTEKLV